MNFDSLNNHLEPTNVNLKSTLHNVTITKNDGMNFNFSAIFILVQVSIFSFYFHLNECHKFFYI